MNDEEHALLYEAGYLAGRLQWRDPVVVSASDISSVTPDGGPVIVIGTDESLTVDKAQAVAAISAAGRPTRLVTARELPVEVAAWLPEGSIHVAGQEVTTPTRWLPRPADSREDFFFFDLERSLSWSGFDALDAAARTQLAAAMRGVKVGLAWDRHIWYAGRFSPHCLLEDSRVLPDALKHSDCPHRIDILSSLGASLTLNVRILDQVILLLCGPWSWDFDNKSGCATASRPFEWGASSPNSDLSDLALLMLQDDSGMSALGEIPSRFRRIPGGEDFVRFVLKGWAIDFFGLIQSGGVAAFESVGVEHDARLQDNWDGVVSILEEG